MWSRFCGCVAVGLRLGAVRSAASWKLNPLSAKTLHPASPSLVVYKAMSTTAVADQTVETVTYENVQDFINENSAIIVDVRQPGELVDGTIPSSCNIPLAEVEHALKDLTDEQFRDKYGRPKPQPTDRLVFSCRSGARAQQATQTALSLGYSNSFNYKGSWSEWAERSKQ